MTVLDGACRDTTNSTRPYQPPKLEVQYSEEQGAVQAKHSVTIAINGVETASLKLWTSVVSLDMSEVV